MNIATKGLEAAGGCITFRYTINATATPTDKPNDKKENPIDLLKIIPTNIEIKCQKNKFFQ